MQTVEYERKREQAMYTLFEQLMGFREPANEPDAGDGVPAQGNPKQYSGDYDSDF